MNFTIQARLRQWLLFGENLDRFFLSVKSRTSN